MSNKAKNILTAIFVGTVALAITFANPTSETENHTEVQITEESEEKDVHWSHDPNAVDGPKYWHKLCDAWKECNSEALRSPIVIPSKAHNSTIENAPFRFVSSSYHPVRSRVIDTGHSYQIPCEGSGCVELELHDHNQRSFKKSFILDQFHHHGDYEHPLETADKTVGESQQHLEFHFVHYAKDGERLVIAVHVNEGKHNPELQNFIHGINGRVNAIINLNELVNAHHGYSYEGSLTTPHRHENKPTHWILSSTPVEASSEQIALIRQKHGQNIRPPQPLQGRSVFKY